MRLSILFILPATVATAAVDFSHQIVPILREHCAECHAGDKKKGGFSFNNRESLLEGGEDGKVVVSGKSAASAMIQAIRSTDPDDQMPPKGKRVPADQIALLKQWIDEGLSWEEGFAFKKPAYEPPLKPRMPVLPAAVEGRSNPIDRILDQYLAQKKYPRPAAIDDATFVRRAYLDLIGLLPSPKDLETFAKDKPADKRANLIKSLLKRDIDYTEHWLTFWNDLLRNDYGGTGFITGGRKQISNWLYHALITNMPFDQFVRELIAPPNDESRGFIDGIKWRGDVSAGQTVEIQFAQSVSQSFLGINMKCASCHDSFIDRWKLSEAYGLAAIYSSRPLEINRCDKPIGQQAVASWLFPEIGQVDAKAAQPERMKQLAALMTHPQNGRTTRTIVNRLWQRLMGRGIVHPVDAMQTEPWSADLLDYLAAHLAEHEYDLKQTLALITTSQAYQSHSQVVTKGIDDHGYVYAGPRAKRLTAEQFVDAIWQITGSAPTKMDAGVLRGKVDPELAKQIQIQGQWIWGHSAKPGSTPPSGETITLRKTIKLDTDPASASAVVTCDNGYTLFVNGRKISAGDDWTKLAAVPLQTALRKGANSILVIATNAGKGPNPAGFFFDARVRDVAGKETAISSDASWEWSAKSPPAKEGRIGAFEAKDWQPVTIVKALGSWQQTIHAQAPSLLAQGAAASDHMVRASLMKSNFLLRTLGRPNRDQIVTARPNDLTTLEAIDLANGSILSDSITKGAQRLLQQHAPSPTALIIDLYHQALCREPSASELDTAQSLLGAKPTQQSLEDLLWAVCMLPEFQVVR
ncbi:MAG: DUF1549 domain-containing protein [Prosthecobacter sp.]|uniref:DUF1549 domain-containing protein n=1 Tax=Prosthecobacter sp. TaxID=1965333 RepID=UPI00262DFD52|nr:DUF1549 domain-containing protein [Prosthecobacter sp.]MCF7789857.1 DUF1549 domain-containing protein [Prosthecobacter sp.]